MTVNNSASLVTNPLFTLTDTNNNPLAGGKVYTYQAGTLIPLATYTDATLTAPNTNPVILDEYGSAQIWLGPYTYKLNVTDQNGVQHPDFPVDNLQSYVTQAATTATAAATTAVLAELASTSAGQGDALIGVLSALTGAVARTQHTKNADSVSALDFGADPLGVTDSSTAINTALTYGKHVYLPAGAYKILNTIIIPVGGSLIGAGRQVTTITVSADVLGILMSGWDALGDISITKIGTHTNNLIDVGNAAGTLGQGRDSLFNLIVANAGAHGICVRNGNLGSFRDVTVNTCGQDGINFTTDTANSNAWSSSGFIDLNSNARDGLHLSMGASAGAANSPRAHMFHGICAQTSGRYGVYIGTTSNLIETYSEASGTADVYLDTYALGNEIKTTSGFVTDNSTKTLGFYSNLIQNYDADASYWRMAQGKVAFSGVAGAGIRIGGDDGTGGQLDFEKSSSGIFKIMSQNTGQDVSIQWLNTAGSYALHQQCGGTVQPLNDNTFSIGTLSRKWGAVYTYNVTTSNLYANTVFLPTQTYNGTASVSATTISTRYTYIATPAATITVTLPAAAAAIDGQVITVCFGTTISTTLTWVSSGATFVGAPAAAAIVANVPVRFIYIHAQLKWLPY